MYLMTKGAGGVPHNGVDMRTHRRTNNTPPLKHHGPEGSGNITGRWNDSNAGAKPGFLPQQMIRNSPPSLEAMQVNGNPMGGLVKPIPISISNNGTQLNSVPAMNHHAEVPQNGSMMPAFGQQHKTPGPNTHPMAGHMRMINPNMRTAAHDAIGKAPFSDEMKQRIQHQLNVEFCSKFNVPSFTGAGAPGMYVGGGFGLPNQDPMGMQLAMGQQMQSASQSPNPEMRRMSLGVLPSMVRSSGPPSWLPSNTLNWQQQAQQMHGVQMASDSSPFRARSTSISYPSGGVFGGNRSDRVGNRQVINNKPFWGFGSGEMFTNKGLTNPFLGQQQPFFNTYAGVGAFF